MENQSYINKAVRKINSLLSASKGFSQISVLGRNFYTFYAATNENLAYFADLGVQDKNTLTVTGSGDHALNLAYFGAKSIETFDINELAIIAFDLKKNAILHLSRDEFLEFYTYPKFFNKKIYDKIYPYLNDVTKAVFDVVYENIKHYRDFELIVQELHLVNKNINRNNPYLSSEQAYMETRRRLQTLDGSLKHKVCPAHRLDKFFDPKDVVILSNILNYCMGQMYDNNSELNFNGQAKIEKFVKAIKNVLADEGLVSMVYTSYYFRYGEQKMKDYFKINGTFKNVQRPKDPLIYDQVFLAKKEDFPEFEK